MFTQMKMFMAGAALLVILGLSATIWIQSGRIDRLKAENKALTEDVSKTVDANKANNATIQDLKAERSKANKLCEKRLADADAKAEVLRKIDETKGGQNEQNSGDIVAGTGGGNTGGTDALLSLLNGMLPGQGGSEDGVHKTVGAERAGRAELLPGQLGYCIDEVNAKHLLKNMVLVRSWALDMQTILTSLQTGTP